MTTKDRFVNSAAAARLALRPVADPKRAEGNARYFKTGPGEYGEGDRFIGVTVPLVRECAARFRDLSDPQILKLLRSPIHEERLLALIIWVEKFKVADEAGQRRIYTQYLKTRAYINNWDLIDSSAEHIVGGYLRDRSRKPIYGLARSRRLWDRRIAVLATFHFIKAGEHGETLKLAKLLLEDREDLMHKAVGWMLREIGKRDFKAADEFLKRHYRKMPRTMLRYAIERHPQEARLAYLQK